MTISLVEATFTIDFEEMDGSPVETLSRDFNKVASTRVIRCPWADRMQMAKEFIGWMELMGGTSIQHLPHRYESINGEVMAKDVKMKPASRIQADEDDNMVAAYKTAELTIDYVVTQTQGAITWNQAGLDIYGAAVLISETITVATEFLTLPHKGLYFGTGETKVKLDTLSAPAKVCTVLEWHYNVSGAILVPIGSIFPGRINSDEVVSTSLGYTFPAETLLCGAPVIRRETSFDTVEFNISLRYFYKNNGIDANGAACGWNHFPNPNYPDSAPISWERITDGILNKRMYELAVLGGTIV